MSLEQAIQENTAAIKSLQSLIVGLINNAQVPPRPAQAAPVEAAAPTAAPTAAPEPVTAAFDMDSCKNKFLKLVASNRNEALRILNVYGVKKLTEIAEDKLPQVYGDILAALGE